MSGTEPPKKWYSCTQNWLSTFASSVEKWDKYSNRFFKLLTPIVLSPVLEL